MLLLVLIITNDATVDLDMLINSKFMHETVSLIVSTSEKHRY